MDKNLTALKQDSPTDARQVRSRKALNTALLSLLAERPFDELTIREITAEAGTGYATFFRHFATKEALLSDLASEPIDALLGEVIPLLEARKTAQSPRHLCGLVERDLPLWTALLTGGAAAIVRAEFIRKAREHARACGGDTPRADAAIPFELALLHGVSSTLGVLTWWLRQHDAFDRDQVAMILQRMVIAPLTQDTLDMQLT